MTKPVIVFLILTTLFSCAQYQYSISGSSIPVSFSRPATLPEKSKRFFIKKKITFVAFDLANPQKFDLKEVLKSELPNAKRIYNLRIRSQEDTIDSIIRTLGTGLQVFFFISDRPLVSRRTIILEGEYVE